MSEAPTTQERVIDYLDKPPQRYEHVSGAMVESATGAWVKFEDMNLYMFEGGQLMQQLAAENDQLRRAARPVVRIMRTWCSEHGTDWNERCDVCKEARGSPDEHGAE
jgi:hypothetical protein